MKLLLRQQPVARDLRVISSALKMISDMERTDSEDEYAYYVARVFGVDESDEDFDYSHGYEYTFYEGTSYEMLNWVKENDCHKAKVRGIGYRIDTEYGNVFSGYWSPDLY